jgi:hypothetical protein
MEVLAVAELSIATSIDQIVRYDDMNAAAGCNIREKRWIILQAKALVNREHGIVLSPKRGIGYRHLDLGSGVKHAGENAMKRTRNAVKNGRNTLGNALGRANDIAPSELRHAYQRFANLGLIEHLSQDKVVRAMPDRPPKRAAVDLDALKKAFDR